MPIVNWTQTCQRCASAFAFFAPHETAYGEFALETCEGGTLALNLFEHPEVFQEIEALSVLVATEPPPREPALPSLEVRLMAAVADSEGAPHRLSVAPAQCPHCGSTAFSRAPSAQRARALNVSAATFLRWKGLTTEAKKKALKEAVEGLTTAHPSAVQ